MVKDRLTMFNSILDAEIVVPTNTENDFESLSGEPSVDISDVARVFAESVAEVSAVNQNISLEDAEIFVLPMGVSDDYNAHAMSRL
jgi:hypothetical protein